MSNFKSNPVGRQFNKNDYYGWRCNEGTAENYIKLCKLASIQPEVFENFKSSRLYQTILEHVPYDLGYLYLQNIKQNNPSLISSIDKFIEINEKIGNSNKNKFSIDGSDFVCSPTTIRYIKVLSDLITLFGSLDGMKIVEIGGGYGGLATIINTHFNLKDYCNIDLEWPAKLSKLYTSSLNVQPFRIRECDNIDDFENIDLVISNYAFSECNLQTREEYIKKILSKSKRGYITHNGDDKRRNETKNFIKKYENFQIFYKDGNKQHPVFTWGQK
jgi:putative sugar O-methyltransferase